MRMKRKSPYTDFKSLKKNLEGMTFGEKVDHIWTYYKEVFFVLLLGGIILYIFAWTIFAPKKEVVFGGALCNVSMKQDFYNYLSESYGNRLGLTGHQVVDIASLVFKAPTLATEVDSSYRQSMSMISMVEAKTVDFMLLDQYAMEFYISHELYLDLREIFTAAELESWGDKVIKAQPEGGEAYPIAIDITELPFIQEASGTQVYIAFAVNTERPDLCRDFWEYILAWKPSE